MPSSGVLDKVVAALRAASQRELPATITPQHSLVADLGFDSMSVAFLGLALEDQFNRPILLNDWIGRHVDPEALRVGSLCEYLETVVA